MVFSNNTNNLFNDTVSRYDYDYIKQNPFTRHFFAYLYLFSNLISAICLLLLFKFYISKKYHKVHEKNLNSTCLSLWIINLLKILHFFLDYEFLNSMLLYTNVITSFLLFATALDLYLTLRSIITDVFVEENLNRRRFLMYSVCGWILPILLIRIGAIYNYDTIDNIAKLHSSLNFLVIVLIFTSLPHYYYSAYTEATEGYKYYSNEKFTSVVVRLLSSIRFGFYLFFLVTLDTIFFAILDFFRAFEGMFIYYYLAVDRRTKWVNKTRLEDQMILMS